MLTLYYTPLSIYSRPVWIALLEKQLQFELVPLKLDGDQFQLEFLAINPFNHVPVLVDDGLRIIESLAILDYLEARYPTPTLLPTQIRDLATVRMVEMVTMTELLPAMLSLIRHQAPDQLQWAKQRVNTVLTFLEDNLGLRPYFGGERLTLAEVVAGSIVPWSPNLDVSLTEYPRLSHWVEQLMQRQAWAITQPSPHIIEDWKRRIKVLTKVRHRQRPSACHKGSRLASGVSSS